MAEIVKDREVEARSMCLNQIRAGFSRCNLLFGIMMTKAVEATTHHALSSLEFNRHHVLERRIALRIAYPPDISTTMNKTKMPMFISRCPKLSSRNRSAASS